MALESRVRGMFRERLDDIKARNLYRRLRTVESAQGSWVKLEGRRVLNLCSNNYLGLAGHPAVIEAGARAMAEWGCSSGASRSICGNMAVHELLERRIAALKGTESALLYTSGYTANLGIISALVGKEDYVFSDELNHASLIDGCRLSQAKVTVFPHSDLDQLEQALRRTCERFPGGRRLIVVDGVFSMDGDLAPVTEIAGLAEKFDSLLMVDEAHATGVLGPGGRGLVASLGLEKRVPVLMGTLSKALGSFGGFAAGNRELTEFLVNTSRSFIFTTGLPPASAACALAALDVLEQDTSLPFKVQENGAFLRQRLNTIGFNTLKSQTQIIPVVVGEAAGAVEMSQLLLERGVLATAIRPPTVPQGTSRIRATVMATHTRADLELAASAFEEAGRIAGII
ncbi:MAG TPA: 8-amino-7-oxononanoate synthase [Dehalococcoidia bacterium]|nr:8-amino-7-oxononanoate synthase [Dehalococcoidia bacterium]